MLRKLIRYEFKATGRVMWPIFCGMVLLTLMARYAAIPLLEHSDFFLFNALAVLVLIAFFVGLLLLGFIPLLISVGHFKKNVLSSEGYLTMTLPVTRNQLLLSKLIVNVVWYAASAAVLFAAFLLLVTDVQAILKLPDFIKAAVSALERSDSVWKAALAAGELLLNLVAAVTLATLICYTSYSIGYSAAKHKTLWTVLLIYALFHLAVNGGIVIMSFLDRYVMRWTLKSGIESFFSIAGANLGVMLLFGAICFFVTSFFLTKKLNLE